MSSYLFLRLALFCAMAVPLAAQTGQARLIIVDPGHFHATLLQREMYPSLAPRVSVYAPLGPDLLDYLHRISLFNERRENPTRWELDIHTSADPMREMLHDRPGNVVLFTGRNRGKIDRILASLSAGLHVLADKPWIISASEMPKLEQALDLADRKGLAAYDIMTERYEVTAQLQRELVNTPEVFGKLQNGSAVTPAIQAKSVHHVMKVVAGVPLHRPAWFFDLAEYGEALADVGTHVIDIVNWIAFPDQALDYRKEIRVLSGRHWPLAVSKEQFQQVTGEHDFPPALAAHVHNDSLDFFCNDTVGYTVRGVYVSLGILWNWEAPAGAGDMYEAAFRGTQARIELRQGKAQKYLPELYVVPSNRAASAEVFAALRKKVVELQSRWPGLAAEETENEAHLVIPQRFNVTHEEHFAQLAGRFFDYMRSPKKIPVWERPNMLAKYYISTRGVELSQTPSR